MIKNTKIIITLIYLTILITSCKNIKVDDLNFIQSATKLTLSPETQFEKTYSGEELTDFLSNFEYDTDKNKGIRLVHNTQDGIIIINGKKYDVRYAMVKTARSQILLEINLGLRKIYLKEKT